MIIEINLIGCQKLFPDEFPKNHFSQLIGDITKLWMRRAGSLWHKLAGLTLNRPMREH